MAWIHTVPILPTHTNAPHVLAMNNFKVQHKFKLLQIQSSVEIACI